MQPLRSFPRVWPQGTFNILPRESIENSRNLPRDSIHHDTPSAFPQIVPNKPTALYWYTDQMTCVNIYFGPLLLYLLLLLHPLEY